MSHAVDLGPVARVADGAINEFSIVKLTADNGVAQSDAADAIEEQHGVVMEIKSNVGSSTFGDAAEAGDVVDVNLVGIVRVRAGDAFDTGAGLMSDANGDAIVATAGMYTIGFALEEATAAGHIVYMLIDRGIFESVEVGGA